MRKEKILLGLASILALILTTVSGRAGTNYTTIARQGSGNWDTGIDGTSGIWQPGLHTASGAVAVDPDATFELITLGDTARVRTTFNPTPPDNSVDPYTSTSLVFPGKLLTVDGDGIYHNNSGAAVPTGEIRFKYPNVTFTKLVMNGGEWDEGDTTSTNFGAGGGSSRVVIHGEVNVNGVNLPIYNDGGADRGFDLDYLTGSGNLEIRLYTDVTTFKPADANSFILSGNTNTYSGTWNIVLGVLQGYGTNSLGTNTITVGPGGALETDYDLNNPDANLILNGRMLLHQSNVFYNVVIGGTNVLSPGLHAAADLNTAYPTAFPATWTLHPPSTSNAISGYIYAVTNNIVVVTKNPSSLTLGTGPVLESATFSVDFAGQAPISYHWKRGTNSIGTFTNINDGGRISGATTTTLTISNVVLSDAGYYLCSASNAVGAVSSLAAQLIVVTEGGVSNFTTTVNQGLGSDWDTPNTWNDTNSATYLAAVYPGSTFEVLPGANLRTPNAAQDATFPIYAGSLQIDGDGVFAIPVAPHIGALQFKHANTGRVTFKKLVMNGGQLNNGQDGSSVIIAGEMDILTNTPIFEPNDSGTGDRGFRIDSWLTGTGSIEVHLHAPGTLAGHDYMQPLNVTCTSNTFSGQWNIVTGVVLGSGANSLGTNNITISEDFFANPGALETLYDIYNPFGTLTISGGGQVLLHQNDSFMAVSIAGTYLTTGTYAFDQLNALYPVNFPLTWIQQIGSASNTASGSITVLGVPISISSSGANVVVIWPLGSLLEATNILGPWTPNPATSPYTNAPTDPAKFYRVTLP